MHALVGEEEDADNMFWNQKAFQDDGDDVNYAFKSPCASKLLHFIIARNKREEMGNGSAFSQSNSPVHKKGILI